LRSGPAIECANRAGWAGAKTYPVQGYAVCPLFSPAEVGVLREAVTTHMARVADALWKPVADTAPDEPFDRRIEVLAETDRSCAQLLATAAATDAHNAPEVAALAHDARIDRLAEELASCRIVDRIFRFRLNSSAFPKQRQAWHSDVSRLDDTDCARLMLTAWIPLSDAGQGTGGLELLPGRLPAPMPHSGRGKATIAARRLAETETVRPEVPAGHALFLDRFTPHRAVPNRSGLTRWSLVVWLKALPCDAV